MIERTSWTSQPSVSSQRLVIELTALMRYANIALHISLPSSLLDVSLVLMTGKTYCDDTLFAAEVSSRAS